MLQAKRMTLNKVMRKLEGRLIRKLEREVVSTQASRAGSVGSVVAGALVSLMLVGAGANARADSSLYSEAQAQSGEQLYAQNCAACHGAKLEGNAKIPALAGKAFLERCQDNGHSVEDLLFIMRSFMPYNEPGKLTKQQYADIMAYMLKVNGIAPDAKALHAEAKALQKILLSLNP